MEQQHEATAGSSESGSSKSEDAAFSWAAFFMAALSMIVAIAALGLSFANAGDDSSNSTAAYAGPALEATVVLSDLAITPNELAVQTGQPLE